MALSGSVEAMSKRWLKSFGDTRRPVRADWMNEFLRDPGQPLELMTGPSSRSTRPAMRPRDLVLLHAVGHGRVFAAGTIESGPRWERDRVSRWDPERWPWMYSCRIHTWVPRVFGGPPTWDHAARVKGQIQFGSPCAQLNEEEYEALLAGLRESRSVLQHPSTHPGSAPD